MKPKQTVILTIIIAMFGMSLTLCLAGSDIEEFRSCSQCGMDRKAYGYSRMLIAFEDGSRVGTCSLHCAVAEIDAVKHSLKSLLVADRNSRDLIEADKAVWVVGGNKRGVMSTVAVWAFSTPAAAQEFTASHGGSVTAWENVFISAQKDR